MEPQNCPACGAVPTIDLSGACVYCEGCELTGPFGGTREESVTLWNRIRFVSSDEREVSDGD